MITSNLIRQQIAAAQALNAPLFGLNRLLIAAVAAEQASADLSRKAKAEGDFWGALAENEHDANLKMFEAAARAAFGFVCCVHGPSELGEYRESDAANQKIIAGLDAARQYK